MSDETSNDLAFLKYEDDKIGEFHLAINNI